MNGHYENVDGHRVWIENTTTSAAPEGQPRPALTDQAQVGAAPDSISALLHLPGVYVRPDEYNAQVVIGIPADAARAIAGYAPDPLQVQLAARLIDAALADITDEQILTTREQQISGQR